MAVAQKTNLSALNLDGAVGTLVITFAAVLNDAIVVNVAIPSTYATVASVVDSLGNTYTKKAGVVASDEVDYVHGHYNTDAFFQNAVDCEVWTTKSTGVVSTITVTLTNPCEFAVEIESYTGVSAFGAGAASALVQTGAPSISFTTTAANSVVLAAFASRAALNQAAAVGTLRGSVNASDVNRGISVVIADIAKAIAGAQAVTLAPANTVVLGGSTLPQPLTYAATIVELKA